MPNHQMISSILLALVIAYPSIAQLPPSADEGLRLLLEKPFLPAAFDQQTFDEVWKNWEEPLRNEAAAATPQVRREMAFRRYGLVEREGDPQHRPVQYVVDPAGNWTMNCLACHQGAVAGRLVPGAANNQFALQTLTEEIRVTKLRLGKPLTDLDLGSMMMPLGASVGTTNAVMFGVALFHFRDADLNIVPRSIPPRLVNHDHDAPAWWNTSRKTRLYADNFAPRGHRALMQFIASKENGPEKFRKWEDDFRHVEAYIDSLQPPQFPYEIDKQLAAAGERVFTENCAVCHGSYREEASYPELIVPLDEIGTDPVRLRSLTVEHRENYGRNWINEYGSAGEVIADPGGYLAPPLDGVWASAPYLHNGSVPTLWHLLHPELRPAVWRVRDHDAYDRQRIGLVVDEFNEMPTVTLSGAERRRYFQTSTFGKSAAGHDFPAQLTVTQRTSVLEYLKTL